MNINDHVWHDKILLNITIDRTTPGIIDEISFEIEDGEVIKKLTFREVYWILLNLNLGIVAKESIYNIQCLDENDFDLISLHKKWNGHLNNKKLYPYLIELNSSGSTIKLIAESFIYQ